ncbi:peptide ABC transporter substrate-binding protein [Vespertiliibacter pulmonis]|uniref:Cationic peptide transport system substrate-binding protein n=1 Tax=Vespertiliibacter pulmonis TaxID=1443036 RepID=A0A3N4W8S9_9PAST|nr:ABC transporter substrate-binding protein [Vespertiliibacter pulmonis]QLB21529.1 peptide ABC transporter substrate-binding protein [Vespertiliibacter pulmonis]RPE85947.1 cationic peptide transport system substrate-binding protein [Vespertiliibacter pulmonis]
MNIFALYATIFVGVLGFFGSSSIAYSAPKIPIELHNNSLVYCTSSADFSLNPQRAEAGSNMNVVTEQIYDKLVKFDPIHHKLQPALAERFEISADGLNVIFYLRKNVSFQHTPWFTPTRKLNADDVVFSLRRMMGSRLELAELTPTEQESIERYQINQAVADGTHFPFFDSTRLKNRIENIVALDPYRVEITLNAPYPTLLEHLASQYAVILSKEYALQLNADENLLQIDRLPVGTGPYQVESYIQNDYIRLIPNSNYWGEKALIANMIIDFSTSATGRMAKFLNGECDISAFPEPSQLSILPKLSSILHENVGANLAFLAFNFQRTQMQNLTLRQYIARSINRERLAQLLFYRIADVAQNVLPQALLLETNPNGYIYQPTSLNQVEIRKILAGSNRLNLWVVDEERAYNPHPLKMAELIRSDLAKVGIELNVRQVSRAYLVQQLEKNQADYDLILGGWLANNDDLDSFLFPILSCEVQKSVTNLSNWCNPQFDALLKQAQLSDNWTEKKERYHQVQQFLQNELPILPLVNARRILIANPNLQNVEISPFGQVNLSKIKRKIEREEAQ